MKALEAIQKIEKNVADAAVRITRRMEIGSAIQQGDLYVHKLPDDWAHGKQIGTGSVQVALGTNNGARHVAEGAVKVFQCKQLPPGVTAPEGIEASELCGPVIKASEFWMLTHPEHPHHKLPKGVYGVTYQFDPKTMRRVAD